MEQRSGVRPPIWYAFGLTVVLLLFSAPSVCFAAQAASAPTTNTGGRSLELSRPVRPWEFLGAVGTRAGVFGWENGTLEAWVYPLKVLRNFRLTFRSETRELPAETLARTIIVRPESSTLTYASDSFSVRETVFVPVNEPGVVIALDVDTHEPLEIEASFERDFQIMWPAGLGGTFENWDKSLKAFVMEEEQKRFAAVIGSPTAVVTSEEYATNYSSSRRSSFRLGPTAKGHDTKVIVIAGSVAGRAKAEETYRKLSAGSQRLLEESAAYYRNYLAQTVSLRLPDAQLEQAYDWSRIGVVQGWVTNPLLGMGLVAGYRTSGDSARPGFAWFFGRDTLWTALALDSAGDFAHAAGGLNFIGKFQRQDGKIPHEISQSASLAPWFEAFPYGYASADATPLFVIAANDYVVSSGDVAFAQKNWTHLWKAYQFLNSTRDSKGLPQNLGIGHGWVEGGPLLPVKSELYQAGLGAEAVHALANLAALTGKSKEAKQLKSEFRRETAIVNQTFWLADKNMFAFAVDSNDRPVAVPSVLATAPMWFDVLDSDKGAQMIDVLAGHDHATDWGMRIISSADSRFDPSGYHYGSVWPLFTGWASVGEYRYHRPLAGYANLRANAALALDGAPGRVTEVLSGAYYEPLSTSSPHQIWSSAMVVSPMLRGLLGLSTDAVANRTTIAPHVPADWDAFEVLNVRVGAATLDMAFRRRADDIELTVQRSGPGHTVLEFSPAVAPRAQVTSVEVNDRRVPFRAQQTTADQHVSVSVPVNSGSTRVHIRLRNDFGIAVPASLPPLGGVSRNLKVISESWTQNGNELTLVASGVSGNEYELFVRGAEQIGSIDGAELLKGPGGDNGRLRVHLPGTSAEGYRRQSITIRFAGTSRSVEPSSQ